MRNIFYYWYAMLAYIRGWLKVTAMSTKYETCSCCLNGKGEARTMYVKHNWIPYVYRRCYGLMSRTFITDRTWDWE